MTKTESGPCIMLLLVHPQFVDRWEYSKDQPSLPLVSPSQNEFEMSRCFVRERNWGFFAKVIARWLSPYITVACGESISLQELGNTVDWRFEDQEIAPLPMFKI